MTIKKADNLARAVETAFAFVHSLFVPKQLLPEVRVTNATQIHQQRRDAYKILFSHLFYQVDGRAKYQKERDASKWDRYIVPLETYDGARITTYKRYVVVRGQHVESETCGDFCASPHWRLTDMEVGLGWRHNGITGLDYL